MDENQGVDMSLLDLSQIPQYEIAEGFQIRSYVPGDKAIWYEIQRASEPYLDIKDGLFEWYYSKNLECLNDRCFFLSTKDGRDIGTATAWWDPNRKGERWGQVHWVGILPEYRGKNLCKPLMTVVMNRIAQSDEKCYLRTSIKRIAALRVYLAFEFSPDPADNAEKQAWHFLAKEMKKPDLIKNIV